MTLAHWIILVLWLGLVTMWVIGATTAKRTISRPGLGKQLAVRLVLLVLIAIVWRTPSLRYGLGRLLLDTRGGPIAAWIGVAICATGAALAATARIQLGRNWGIPGSLKENPDLITGGPYRVIRHPIYTGILLAITGTALTESLLWFLPLVVALPYFILAARREERLMLEQFPDQYPGYRRRTKMLIPWLV